MVKTIKKILDSLQLNSRQEYIIYPFGTNGMITKGLLNSKYGIKESFIVDQNNEYIEGVKRISDIKNANQYKWILNCTDRKIHSICRNELDKIVENENIIDFYRIIMKDDFDSKLKNNPTIASECKDFLKIIKEKKQKGNVSVAEIGIGVGATSVQVGKILEAGDVFTLMDFKGNVENVAELIKSICDSKCEINTYGNTGACRDSYCWGLSDILLKMKKDNVDGIWDVVYLDGAHDFAIDGLATALIKKLLKVGGVIIFDDINWSYKNSKTCCPENNPEILNIYTIEQIECCQVKRVIDIFMDDDKCFEKYLIDGKGREAYIRIR